MLAFVGHAEDHRALGDPLSQASARPNRVRWSPVRMTAGQEQEATALMIRAQQGDALAYAALLTILASTARHYVRNRVGDVAWLDDVAQETLLTIHKARRTYDSRRPFAPWFYAILSSRMIDVLRREKRIGAREIGTEVLPEHVAQVPETSGSATTVDSRVLETALEALPERQREVVTALKLNEQSVKEVSERLGMSESAVKVTAHRGYKALRRFLGGRES